MCLQEHKKTSVLTASWEWFKCKCVQRRVCIPLPAEALTSIFPATFSWFIRFVSAGVDSVVNQTPGVDWTTRPRPLEKASLCSQDDANRYVILAQFQAFHYLLIHEASGFNPAYKFLVSEAPEKMYHILNLT